MRRQAGKQLITSAISYALLIYFTTTFLLGAVDVVQADQAFNTTLRGTATLCATCGDCAPSSMFKLNADCGARQLATPVPPICWHPFGLVSSPVSTNGR